jgi:hypothetical protein
MATNRVLVERLRPQTTQSVVVRPVDTYIRPAPVQDGKLQKLANYLERLEPRFSRLMAAEDEQRKEEEKKQARELAETTTATYDDLVKQGKIGPEASPVFRYAFNETRGEVAGYTFIQEASEAYMKSGMDKATDASNFDDWYQNYYNQYVENNKDVLGMDGAYETFSKVAGQARNNLLNSHLGDVRKNFADAQAAAYTNWVFGTLDNADLSTEEGQAALRNAFGVKQKDIASSGGPQYNYTALNNSTVDSLVAYYEAKGFDTIGLETALNTLQGGTGPLAGTAYARTKLAEARVKFAKEQIAAEQRIEAEREINESRVSDNVDTIFYTAFNMGNYNVEEIVQSLDPVTRAEMETFKPSFIADMTAKAEAFKNNRQFTTMSIADRARLRADLEALPPEKRKRQVLTWAEDGRIPEVAVFNNLISFADSSEKAVTSGINTDATKDSVYNDFKLGVFKSFMDQADPSLAARREHYFQTSYFEMFDEVDAEGTRLWDTYSFSEKRRLLYGIVQEIQKREEDEAFTSNLSNGFEPLRGSDGKPIFIQGNPVFKQIEIK